MCVKSSSIDPDSGVLGKGCNAMCVKSSLIDPDSGALGKVCNAVCGLEKLIIISVSTEIPSKADHLRSDVMV